jgi:hypothetical protein
MDEKIESFGALHNALTPGIKSFGMDDRPLNWLARADGFPFLIGLYNG